MSRRDFLRLAAVFGGTSLLAACAGPGSVAPPSGERPSTVARKLGLDADVSQWDARYSVATPALTDFMRGLVLLQNDPDADPTIVQDYVDYFETAGPLTAAALHRTYSDWLVERTYESMPFNRPDLLGIIPLNTMMPDWSLPSMHANDAGTPSQTNFPVDADTNIPAPVDFDTRLGSTETWMQKFLGLDQCGYVEDGGYSADGTSGSPIGSIDMLMHTYFQNGQQVKPWHAVYSGNLIDAMVTKVIIDDRTTPDLSQDMGANVTFEQEVEGDDRILVNAPYMLFIYAHILASEENRLNTKADFPAEGSIIHPGTPLGGISQHIPGLFELDLTVALPGQFSGGAYDPGSDTTQMEILGAKHLPAGQRMVPTQQRYLDDRVEAPCVVGVNLPAQP